MLISRLLNIHSLRCLAPVIARSLTTQQHSFKTTQFLSPLNAWIYQRNDKIKSPSITNNYVDLPNGLRWVPPLIEPIKINTEIIAPTVDNSDTPKEAVRMIVVRRKKMKKHKLKKLRKRMRFEWGKIRRRREMKKEKAFQAILIQQCKEAEAFCAEDYVNKKLDKLHEIVIPKYWKGKRLPEFIVRQKMGLPPK